MAVATASQQRFDVNWPLRADGKGYFAPCRNEAEDIKQSIRHCLYVGPRQQLFRMGGCDLRALVWEEDDLVFESLAGLLVKQSLKRETRIAVLDVVIHRADSGNGATRVTIEVQYQQLGTKVTSSLSTSATYYR